MGIDVPGINKKTVTWYEQNGLFDATPPGIIPGTAGSPPGLSHYTPGIIQDRHTTWNKTPCRRREVARLLPCPPFHFSSAFKEYITATAGVEGTFLAKRTWYY